MLNELPNEIRDRIEKFIGERVKDFSFVSGGCINSGGELSTKHERYFLKWNDRIKYPSMFTTEAIGLSLLREPGVIDIPEVFTAGETDNFQFLLLEFIASGQRSAKYSITLGEQLAALHRITSNKFGLDHDNYVGSLRQSNDQSESGVEFFMDQRLKPLLEKAIREGHAPASWQKRFTSLFAKLPDLLPTELASLVHGDLWSGNVITNESGLPCLIDPAVCYGNREIDLAMTRLFGGFDKGFYDAYNVTLPLVPGFEQRVDLYNLYPLLVHVILFGNSYVAQVESTLRQYE